MSQPFCHSLQCIRPMASAQFPGSGQCLGGMNSETMELPVRLGFQIRYYRHREYLGIVPSTVSAGQAV